MYVKHFRQFWSTEIDRFRICQGDADKRYITDALLYSILRGWVSRAIAIDHKIDELFDDVGLFFTAPEVLGPEKYDKSCDIWSLGVIMYIL